MKSKKNAKFSFQKFEIARLGKKMITGGDNTGDPDTTTNTSDNCSTFNWCKKNKPKPKNTNDPFDPFDPNDD